MHGAHARCSSAPKLSGAGPAGRHSGCRRAAGEAAFDSVALARVWRGRVEGQGRVGLHQPWLSRAGYGTAAGGQPSATHTSMSGASLIRITLFLPNCELMFLSVASRTLACCCVGQASRDGVGQQRGAGIRALPCPAGEQQQDMTCSSPRPVGAWPRAPVAPVCRPAPLVLALVPSRNV